jgi:hypothetical protein
MPTDDTNERAETLHAGAHEPRLEDLLLGLDGFIVAVQVAGADEQVKAQQPALWEAAWRLIGDLKSKDATEQQVRTQGFFLALQAIAATPGTLERMFEALQDQVTVRLIPTVARLVKERPAAAPGVRTRGLSG